MDTSWIEIQSRAFTHWVNALLRKHQLGISTLETDLFNEKIFVPFAREVCGKAPPKIVPSKLHFKKMENFSRLLEFLSSNVNVEFTCTSSDLNEKSQKQILGMVWACMQHVISSKDGGEGDGQASTVILAWINSLPGNKVTSIVQGMLEGSILPRVVKAVCPEAEVTDEAGEKQISRALSILDEEAGIPSILSPQKVIAGTQNRETLIYLALVKERVESKAEELALFQADAAANADKMFSDTDVEEVMKQVNCSKSVAGAALTRSAGIVSKAISSLRAPSDEVISDLYKKLEQKKAEIVELQKEKEAKYKMKATVNTQTDIDCQLMEELSFGVSEAKLLSLKCEDLSKEKSQGVTELAETLDQINQLKIELVEGEKKMTAMTEEANKREAILEAQLEKTTIERKQANESFRDCNLQVKTLEAELAQARKALETSVEQAYEGSQELNAELVQAKSAAAAANDQIDELEEELAIASERAMSAEEEVQEGLKREKQLADYLFAAQEETNQSLVRVEEALSKVEKAEKQKEEELRQSTADALEASRSLRAKELEQNKVIIQVQEGERRANVSAALANERAEIAESYAAEAKINLMTAESSRDQALEDAKDTREALEALEMEMKKKLLSSLSSSRVEMRELLLRAEAAERELEEHQTRGDKFEKGYHEMKECYEEQVEKTSKLKKEMSVCEAMSGVHKESGDRYKQIVERLQKEAIVLKAASHDAELEVEAARRSAADSMKSPELAALRGRAQAAETRAEELSSKVKANDLKCRQLEHDNDDLKAQVKRLTRVDREA